MKRIGLIGAVGALSMALLVPAAVSAHAASPPWFWAQIEKATCTNHKGKYGFGKVVLQMRGFARNDLDDSPTPNYIVVTGWHQQKIDGVWVNGGKGWTTSPIYPDGHADVFQGMYGMSWSFPEPVHPRTRMLMKVEFFDDLPTGDVRLGKVSGRTEAC